MKTVTRQSQWPDGNLVVEISDGGIDYSNPGALVQNYPGEFEEFQDPREAVETAIKIAQQWQADKPNETILIAHGATGGMTMPFEGEPLTDETFAALREWAEKLVETTPKCEQCGDPIFGSKWHPADEGGVMEDWDMCSEQCCENWLADQAQANHDELVASYPDGECPDCGEEIPDDAMDGSECANCGHVFYTQHV